MFFSYLNVILDPECYALVKETVDRKGSPTIIGPNTTVVTRIKATNDKE